MSKTRYQIAERATGVLLEPSTYYATEREAVVRIGNYVESGRWEEEQLVAVPMSGKPPIVQQGTDS